MGGWGGGRAAQDQEGRRNRESRENHEDERDQVRRGQAGGEGRGRNRERRGSRQRRRMRGRSGIGSEASRRRRGSSDPLWGGGAASCTGSLRVGSAVQGRGVRAGALWPRRGDCAARPASFPARLCRREAGRSRLSHIAAALAEPPRAAET